MLQVKSDWRNKLEAKMLEHLLRIKCAAPECGSTATHKLLSSSVDRFFQSKCRQPSSKPYGPRTKKLKLAMGKIDDVIPEPTAGSDTDSYSDN